MVKRVARWLNRRQVNSLSRFFTHSQFFADVWTLTVGTAAARLIGFAAMPLVTRIYTPDDFAVLAAFSAIVGMIAVVSCARLEAAIPMAESAEEAAQLITLSLSFLLILVVLSITLTLAFPEEVSYGLDSFNIGVFAWMIPLAVLANGLYLTFQNSCTRDLQFGTIARTRVTQAVLGGGTSISFGVVGLSPFGLLLANVLNSSAGAFRLGLTTATTNSDAFKMTKFNDLRKCLRKFKKFPLISAPEAFLNAASVKVGILLIAVFDAGQSGYLFLAMQLMTIPLTVVGGSVSRVYISRAKKYWTEGSLAENTRRLVTRLGLIITIPLVCVCWIAPDLFSIVFGEDWRRAGEIFRWTGPWTLFQFIVSPISAVMYVVGEQKELLIVRFISLIAQTFSILIPVYIFDSCRVIESFAIVNALIYLFLIHVCLKASKKPYDRGENYN